MLFGWADKFFGRPNAPTVEVKEDNTEEAEDDDSSVELDEAEELVIVGVVEALDANETTDDVVAVEAAATDMSNFSNNSIIRSGRVSRAGPRFHELNFMNVDIKDAYLQTELLCDEIEYLRDEIPSCGEPKLQVINEPFSLSNELSLVGAGIGGGFITTMELHVLKCDEAMKQTDTDKWNIAVKVECDNLMKHDVFKVVPLTEAIAAVLSSTRAMKKKADGRHGSMPEALRKLMESTMMSTTRVHVWCLTPPFGLSLCLS